MILDRGGGPGAYLSSGLARGGEAKAPVASDPAQGRPRLLAASGFIVAALLIALMLSSCSGGKPGSSTVVDFEMTLLAGSTSTTLSVVQGEMPALVTLWTST